MTGVRADLRIGRITLIKTVNFLTRVFGFAETNDLGFTPPDVMQGLMKNVPIGRAGTSDEMARIIAFLASDDSSYLTGATIDANGGMWVV